MATGLCSTKLKKALRYQNYIIITLTALIAFLQALSVALILTDLEIEMETFQLISALCFANSEKGKQKIQCLLDQVYGLLPIEQLLLYLKLPTEQTGAVDPLRQSMNPLGSRSEINQTIIWIQTHLEEDKELSLQKKGVYDDYVSFCEPNGIKPLSTADFGKVMKQVYPNVRPRRLGTRGQSKYCYSGLRSRVKLDAPLLPDLSDKPMVRLRIHML